MSDPDAKNNKTFFLRPDQIERLVDDPRGCLATDRIVVDGESVGYMYREEPSVEDDSGWRFMAGDESTEYMADANNIGVYALNSIANYDQDIIGCLGAAAGAYFVRNEHGALVRLVDEESQSFDAGLNPDFPGIQGDYQVTKHWQLTLPVPCNRRIEDGTLVLWRPGLTMHVVAWDNTPGDSVSSRVEQLLASVSPDATELTQTQDDKIQRVSYRLNEDGTETLATFVVGEDSQLLAQIYFDDESSQEIASTIAASIGPVTDETANTSQVDTTDTNL